MGSLCKIFHDFFRRTNGSFESKFYVINRRCFVEKILYAFVVNFYKRGLDFERSLKKITTQRIHSLVYKSVKAIILVTSYLISDFSTTVLKISSHAFGTTPSSFRLADVPNISKIGFHFLVIHIDQKGSSLIESLHIYVCAYNLFVYDLTHRVSLAASCLPVGNNCSIIPIFSAFSVASEPHQTKARLYQLKTP